MKILYVIISILVIAIAGFLVFSGKSSTLSSTMSISATTNPVASQSNAKTIKVKSFQFGFDPSTIQLNQGDVVTIELSSTDVSHGIFIPDLGFSLKVDGGQTASGTFTASKKGTFVFQCNVPCGTGHKQMKGTLIVN